MGGVFFLAYQPVGIFGKPPYGENSPPLKQEPRPA
ncbi:hypothetical protein EBI_26220 [Enterocytozoon bieneusi H348]|nr:hypothetical protein EBI_26220 [Enterocytozoon bieneusi H348]|eukprot:XP_002650570.1 hypothetical protein EBI_26220 [Enterocytozoon bieneusi H348]